MVSSFKDRSPVTVVWLLILSVVVHSHSIIDFTGVAAFENNGLLSLWLNKYITHFNPAVLLAIFHALVLIEALRLNFLFTDHRMYSRQNFLAAMVYVLLTGVFKDWTVISPALLDNILVIWFFAKTVRLYNNPNPKTLLFNIGLIIGCSTLLYHPSALLVIVAFFALMVVRPFIITEWLVLLMGVLFPFYLLAAYLYLTNSIDVLGNFIPDWAINLPVDRVSVMFFVTAGLIVVMLMIGLYYWQQENRRLLIQVRKNWVVLLVMLLVMLPIPFINYKAGIDSLLLWIVPASPFIAKGFLGPKKPFLPNFMFWCLLAIAIIKNWQLIQ